MAEATIENQICSGCGSEVRPNALFCYHCGGSVAPEVIALKDKEAVSGALVRETISDEKNGDKPALAEKPAIEKTADDSAPKTIAVEEPQLKSAAAMRRSKSKSIQPKRVEIIWEEHQNPPNGWFIAVAIFLTLFAAGVLYLAIYLK